MQYLVRQGRAMASAAVAILTLSTGAAPASEGDRLPRVLIIGDSISIGYTKPVQQLLDGRAEVVRIPGNGEHTWTGMDQLPNWLGDGRWDVIHFNWGLYDLKRLKDGKYDIRGKRVSTLEQYADNLDQLVGKLKATGAKLIWASTTPIPAGAAGRVEDQEVEFNTAARAVMDKHGAAINDLHTCVRPYLDRYQLPKNVHFTPEGYEYLARQVARRILNTVRNPRPPFAMPDVKPPVFADRAFSIPEYGAVPDGRTPCTEAIAKAIADCSAAGGGRVLVPAGVWLTGAIHLKNDVNLHLDADAELRFSTNPKDYLPPVFVRWAGLECRNYSPLIYANGCTNIALTGQGKLEGQGRPWWGWVKEQDRVSRLLYEMVLKDVPADQRVFGNEVNPLRPQLFQPINCRNVLIEGVHFTSGPFWTIQAVYCENVLVRGITIINEGPNNDGFNADSCRNVVVEHCTFSTGDDSVVAKSGLNEDGRRVNRPTENMIVRHCRMMRGHGGVVIGSDMSGGVRNVFVHDCDFSGSMIGIRLKSSRARGGVVENVWYQDIELGRIKQQAITVHTDYKAYFGSDTGMAPTFRNIHIRDANCHKAAQAVRIVGLPEQAIENMTLENVIANADRGMVIADAKGIDVIDSAITPKTGPAIQIADSRDIRLRNMHCPKDADPFLDVAGKCENVRVINSDLSGAKLAIKREEGMDARAVTVESAPGPNGRQKVGREEPLRDR